MTTEIKIGTKLFYKPGSQKEWVADEVTNETRGTWLVGHGYGPYRVNKKTMLTPRDRQGFSIRFFTAEQRDASDFCDRHARNLGSIVSFCRDPGILSEIAALVGYKMGE